MVPLIDDTVSERVLGFPRLLSQYNGLSTISSGLNEVPLIIHVTGNGVVLLYPQLMVTSLPLHTVVFSGGVVIVTKAIHIRIYTITHTVRTYIAI